MGTFYNTHHPLISHLSRDLVFAVDYGNPKCLTNSLKGAPKDVGPNGVVFTDVGTSSLGHAKTTSTFISYTRYKDNTLQTHDYSNGFSAIAICSVDKSGSNMFQDGGIVGSGTTTASHFFNFGLTRTGIGFSLWHRITNAAGTGTVTTTSDYQNDEFPEVDDNKIFMVGMSHSISSLTFYAHGLPIDTKSISSSINTTYPDFSGNSWATVNGHGWQQGSSRFHKEGKIFMTHVYKRPLTDAEHLSFFNTFKNRYNL